MKRSLLLDIIDWLGVILILGAYTLLSFGLITPSYAFQIPTLIGSLAVAVVSWVRRDKQPAILNFAFTAIAVIAIIRLAIFH